MTLNKAFEIPGMVYGNAIAAEDLSDNAGKFVGMNAAGEIIKITSAVREAIGLQLDNPSCAFPVEIAITGIYKVKSSSAFNIPARVGMLADGSPTVATSSVLGWYLTDSSNAGNFCTIAINTINR